MVPGQPYLPGILQRSELVQQQREVLTGRIHAIPQPDLLSEEPGCLVPVLGCQLSIHQAVVLPEGSLHQQGPCPSICSHVSQALHAPMPHTLHSPATWVIAAPCCFIFVTGATVVTPLFSLLLSCCVVGYNVLAASYQLPSAVTYCSGKYLHWTGVVLFRRLVTGGGGQGVCKEGRSAALHWCTCIRKGMQLQLRCWLLQVGGNAKLLIEVAHPCLSAGLQHGTPSHLSMVLC